tara:strand:- start:88 stop:1965 length:1878 start_codon:yes stop_codon:yes gene_type:complete
LIIVVDTHFFPKEVLKKNSFLTLFPEKENDHALRFNLDELLKISSLESEIIDRNIDKISKIFLKENIYPNDHYNLILRMYFTGILNVFIDRALRVLHLKRNFDLSEMKVMNVEKIKNFPSGVTEDMIGFILTESGHSWQFNQDILSTILSSFDIKQIEKKLILKNEDYPEYNLNYQFKNLLFYPERNIFFDKVKNKISSKLPKIVKSVPTFDVAQEVFYLKKAGMFGPLGVLDEFQISGIRISEKNISLRKNLREGIYKLLIEISSELLRKIDSKATNEEIDKIVLNFPSIFMNYFPSSCLEAAETNVNLHLKDLRSNKSEFVFGHGISGQNGIFAATASKICGKKIVGFQHGGQYGYIEDLFQFAQTEYQNSDIYVTWGWSDKEIDGHLPKFKSMALPAPQFSERPIELKSEHFVKEQFNSKPDILFISNKFNRFPFVCSGGTNRIDFIDRFKQGIRSLVLKAKESNNSIVVKAYSKNRYELLKDFWDEISILGGSNYKLYDSWDKGLSSQLVSTAKIMVWDQIGTGTLQCFTADIPTLVYWERFHSRETSWARPYIQELEKVGIVHNELNTLFNEISQFINDPISWKNNEKRKKAISSFCFNYAHTDKNWKKIWKKEIKEKLL